MKLKEGLIVSCQALPNEPMFGEGIMAKFAYAAYLGGASGIRANGISDISQISKTINHELPLIGIIKKDYKDSEVYITPTLKEVKDLIDSECDVIALDATFRLRPNNEKLIDLINYIKNNSKKLIMADCATLKEAINADKLGFDYISTTLRSYTEETKGYKIPDIRFLNKLLKEIDNKKIVLEGGISSPEILKKVLKTKVKYVVIGGAITRPLEITKRYIKEFKKEN